MTTTVEFRVFESSDTRALDTAACQLIAEWVAGGATVCVIADDRVTAERFDTALWNFDEQSFIPHEVAESADARPGRAPLPAVLITIGRSVTADILVNLGQSVPVDFESHPRVVDFVDAEPARRDAGRRRFVAYRERGFPPQTYKAGH
jgi:DNA polymerase-3 subunit chi